MYLAIIITVGLVLLGGFISDTGNNNTWENLLKIYTDSTTRKKEIELEIQKEVSKQMATEFAIKQKEK